MIDWISQGKIDMDDRILHQNGSTVVDLQASVTTGCLDSVVSTDLVRFDFHRRRMKYVQITHYRDMFTLGGVE